MAFRAATARASSRALTGYVGCAPKCIALASPIGYHVRNLATRTLASSPVVSMSKSKWQEKRGKPHGSPFLQCKGTLSPTRLVPSSIPLPPYARGLPIPSYPEPEIHDKAGQDRMRHAGSIAARILAAAGEHVRAGVTTDDIDAFVHAETLRHGAFPSPLGYGGFPKSVCASVNEVVCHGIPDSYILQQGDILKLDVSCWVGGVHGDTCRTFIVGGDKEADEAGRTLVAATKRMLDSSIALCGPGNAIRSIGAHIEAACEVHRLDTVSAFSGHGIGQVFHTNPIVQHHSNSSMYVMRPGMTFTIEPMIVEGSADVDMWPDGWTVVTRDRGRCAQFEHTILITEHGHEILTRYE